MKSDLISFSSTLTRKTKSLLEAYCKKRGMKMNHFLEEAILEKLEDEMDSEIIASREFEKMIPWKKSA